MNFSVEFCETVAEGIELVGVAITLGGVVCGFYRCLSRSYGPSWASVLLLGMIVLIRTFLSFSLEIGLDGVVPWKRRKLEQEPE